MFWPYLIQEIVMSVIELASGHAMPLLGLGTWQLRGDECTSVVQMALEMGYRHLDTAYNYKTRWKLHWGFRRVESSAARFL